MKKLIVFTLMVLMLSSFALAGAIEDDFDRANSASLGTATNGYKWHENIAGDNPPQINAKRLFFDDLGGGTGSNYIDLALTAANPNRIDYWNFTILDGGSGSWNLYFGASSGSFDTGGQHAIYCYHKAGGSMWCHNGGAWISANWTTTEGVGFDLSYRNINPLTYTFDIWINDIQRTWGMDYYNNVAISNISMRLMEQGASESLSVSCLTGNLSACEAPAPPGGDSLNLTAGPLPADATQFNTLTLNVNVTVNASQVWDAKLYLNGVLNSTVQYAAGANQVASVDLTFSSAIEKSYVYSWYLNTSDENITTANKTFHIDNVFPQITWNTPNNVNTTVIGGTLYSNIFLQDPNMFSYYYNITRPNGVQYHYSKNETLTGLTNYTINDTVNFVGEEGYFNAYVEVCDGHTGENITLDSVGINNVTLVVEDEGDHINVSMLDGEDTESVSYTEEDDQVSFGFVSDTTTSSEQFIVKSNNYIHILDGLTEYEGHLVMGKKWVDFETDDLKSVHILRLSDYSVQVTVTKFTSTDEWDFQSIGVLNCRNQTRSFFVHVPLKNNNSEVLSGDVSEYLLNVTLNSSYYTTANATLYWNGSAYPASAVNTSDYFYFSTSIIIPPSPENVNITYYWNYYLGSHEFNTTNQNTSVFAPKIGNCSYYPTQWVEYKIKDETFETLLNGSITFQFKYYNNAYSNSFNGLMTDNTTFPICMYPSWANFSTNATIQYQTSESGYTAREYQTLGFGVYESNRSVDLFLLAGAAEITFHIIDDSDNNLQGVTIEAYRYRIATDTDVLVETESTDAEGKVILDLASGTTFYSFKIYDAAGTLKISTARFKLFSTEYEYIIQEGRENPLATMSNIMRALTQSLTYNTDQNNVVNYTYNYTGSIVSTWCLTVVANATTYSLQCSNNSAGTFNYTITAMNLSYMATALAYTNASDYVVNNLAIDTRTQLKDVFGNTNTLFIALIMFLTIGLIGLVSANIAIVLSVLALIIIGLFNLLPLSDTWIAGAVALAMGLLWVVNKR